MQGELDDLVGHQSGSSVASAALETTLPVMETGATRWHTRALVKLRWPGRRLGRPSLRRRSPPWKSRTGEGRRRQPGACTCSSASGLSMSPCPSRRRAHAGATQHAFGFDIRDFVKIGDAARADLPVTEHLQLWVFAVATFMRQQASEPEAHRRVNSLERALNVGLQALRAHFVRHRQKLKNPANVVEGSPEHERLGSQVFFGGKKFGKLHRIPPPPDAYPGVVVSDWRQLFTWLSGPCLGALPDLPQRQFAPAAGTSKKEAVPGKDNFCYAFAAGTGTRPASRCKLAPRN